MARLWIRPGSYPGSGSTRQVRSVPALRSALGVLLRWFLRCWYSQIRPCSEWRLCGPRAGPVRSGVRHSATATRFVSRELRWQVSRELCAIRPAYPGFPVQFSARLAKAPDFELEIQDTQAE